MAGVRYSLNSRHSFHIFITQSLSEFPFHAGRGGFHHTIHISDNDGYHHGIGLSRKGKHIHLAVHRARHHRSTAAVLDRRRADFKPMGSCAGADFSALIRHIHCCGGQGKFAMFIFQNQLVCTAVVRNRYADLHVDRQQCKSGQYAAVVSANSQVMVLCGMVSNYPGDCSPGDDDLFQQIHRCNTDRHTWRS